MSLKLDLNDGSNVTQALQVFQSALLLACTDTTQAVSIQESLSQVKWQGIWGRKVPLSHVLKDGDRLEIYRPLRVDPKLARKQRFKGQGKGRTGLFARRRVGGVAGY